MNENKIKMLLKENTTIEAIKKLENDLILRVKINKTKCSKFKN